MPVGVLRGSLVNYCKGAFPVAVERVLPERAFMVKCLLAWSHIKIIRKFRKTAYFANLVVFSTHFDYNKIQSMSTGQQGVIKRMTKIYMDNCCFNRLFDDRSNIKNFLEREAVLLLLQKAYDGEITVIGSDALSIEMTMIKDAQKLANVLGVYHSFAKSIIELSDEIKQRAHQIQDISNIKAFDSLHLASAEAGADIMLTTDIKFLKACSKLKLSIPVQNPIQYVMEVFSNDADD